jgi:hypothetical protein
MLELQDLLDLEILKGTRATPELSLIDIDAAVQSVVKMFKISIQNKVSKLLHEEFLLF